MVVATQQVFAHTDALTEIWKLGAATPARTLVIQGERVGVTLTDTRGVTKADITVFGDIKVTGVQQPGVGNDEVTWAQGANDYAVGVATDGTWEFPVTGATASIAQGAVVYVTGAGAATLTEGSNTKIGVVNFPGSYIGHGETPATLPVKIGV